MAAQAGSDSAQSASGVVESVVHAAEAVSDNAQAANTSAVLTSPSALPEPVQGTSAGSSVRHLLRDQGHRRSDVQRRGAGDLRRQLDGHSGCERRHLANDREHFPGGAR